MPWGVVVSIGSRRLRKCAPADRAGEAIQPNHNQGLAAADVAQQACQHRPAAVSAGCVLFEDRRAASCAQFVELRIGALVFGGNARVADQTACCFGFLAVLPHLSAWLPLRRHFYRSIGRR